MEKFSYSVIIRTTGNAHEKYQKLLDSISGLIPQPEEIIVVLPEGYPLPNEKLGSETFYYSPKGMVIQRITGIEKCKSRYALICDDDIAFGPQFVENLSKPVISGKYAFSAGPLVSFFPCKGTHTILAALIGSAAPTIWHKDRYTSILMTTGYSYNRNIDSAKRDLYETQSAPWTCFFADIEAFRTIHFEDEIWLDKCGYSAFDDATMFYKGWLNNKKTVIVANAEYRHLDAKTSTRGNYERCEYAIGFNTIIFWHRFIFLPNKGIKRIISKICISYRIGMQKIFNYLKKKSKRMTDAEFRAYLNGVSAAKLWIKTPEYKMLPTMLPAILKNKDA